MDQVKNIDATIENMEDINIIVQHKKTSWGYQYKATLATEKTKIDGE